MNVQVTKGFVRLGGFMLVIAAFVLLGTIDMQAQTARQISGTIRDAAGQGVSGASITLVSKQDSLQSSTDSRGFYDIRGLKDDVYTMTVTSLGFETLVHRFEFEANRSQLHLSALELKASSEMLDEIAITAKIDIVVKEDTLEYNTKDLKLREGSLVEDALKRLDGVEVDKDGNVTAQGETISRVRINGKDFFGGDVRTATQNLPADIIDRIQVVDDYGDMANITGNRSGDPERILNIQIDPEYNRGSLGNFRLGGGSEERYQATGMIGLMREGMQFTALGNLNNVNASLFDFNVQGGGARRGGGRRGGGFGGGLMGGRGGLTNTNSIGMNYRQDFNSQLTMYGSYSLSHEKNTTLSYNINDYFNEELLEVRDNQTGSRANDHRFDWNIEYRPTDQDYLKFSPSVSIADNRGDGYMVSDNSLAGNLINQINTVNSSNNFSPNYGASGLYNRRLSDAGRNIFVDFSLNTASTEQDEERIQESLLFEDGLDTESYIRTIADLQNKSMNGGASLSYTEPLGEYTSLEVNYDYNFRNYDNRRFDNALDQSGEQIIDDEIVIGNRIFDYSFMTHRAGVTYRHRSDKIVYSVGASVEPNRLKGDATLQDQFVRIDRSGINFAPIARFEYKFSRTKSFSVRYWGRANEPSFSQLQPFTDYSNRNFLQSGNPDLGAEFRHSMSIRFNNFNVGSGQSWFASVSGSMTDDKIVSDRSIFVDPTLGVVQTTSYLNTHGVYNLRGYYHYSIPFKDRTYVMRFNGFANFNNNISYTDGLRNVGENWQLMQGFGIRYVPSENLEISPGVQYSYNTTTNSTLSNRGGGASNHISSWGLTLNSSVNITPTWVFGTDMAKMSNTGYSNLVGADPFIINAYLEKKFLKNQNGAIRIHAYDLLNEQTNVSRNVSDNLISDSRVNRLGQYFMLTLSYRFQNFGGGEMEFDLPRGDRGRGSRGGRF